MTMTMTMTLRLIRNGKVSFSLNEYYHIDFLLVLVTMQWSLRCAGRWHHEKSWQAFKSQVTPLNSFCIDIGPCRSGFYRFVVISVTSCPGMKWLHILTMSANFVSIGFSYSCYNLAREAWEIECVKISRQSCPGRALVLYLIEPFSSTVSSTILLLALCLPLGRYFTITQCIINFDFLVA